MEMGNTTKQIFTLLYYITTEWNDNKHVITTNPSPVKGDITIATIRLQTYLFAPYRDGEGGVIDSAVGASPHPILLYPYGVDPQQIKSRRDDTK